MKQQTQQRTPEQIAQDCKQLSEAVKREAEAAADRGEFKALEFVYYFLLSGKRSGEGAGA